VTPSDLATLHRAAFEFPRPWTEAEFALLLADRTVFQRVKDHGFFFARAVAEEAELLTLAVHPAARRRGIGRRLVDAFLTDAAARGAKRAFLEVAASNAPALALYAASGFSETGRRPRYFIRPDATREDALVLSRAL
jgi:ribosomal-protein-alanine N-acetyltransferase